jgi:hypothetical protein
MFDGVGQSHGVRQDMCRKLGGAAEARKSTAITS